MVSVVALRSQWEYQVPVANYYRKERIQSDHGTGYWVILAFDYIMFKEFHMGIIYFIDYVCSQKKFFFDFGYMPSFYSWGKGPRAAGPMGPISFFG